MNNLAKAKREVLKGYLIFVGMALGCIFVVAIVGTVLYFESGKFFLGVFILGAFYFTWKGLVWTKGKIKRAGQRIRYLYRQDVRNVKNLLDDPLLPQKQAWDARLRMMKAHVKHSCNREFNQDDMTSFVVNHGQRPG